MRYACYVVFDLAETWYKRTCRTGPQQLREVLSLCQRASAFIWQAFVESVLNLKKKRGKKKVRYGIVVDFFFLALTPRQ